MPEAPSRVNEQPTADANAFALRRIAATVGEWRRRARSRRDLMALDPRDLRDLRLTPADALREARKLFWKE